MLACLHSPLPCSVTLNTRVYIFLDTVCSLFLLTPLLGSLAHSLLSELLSAAVPTYLEEFPSAFCAVSVCSAFVYLKNWLDDTFVLIGHGCFSLAAEFCIGRLGCFLGLSATQPHLWCLEIAAVWMGNPLSLVSVVPYM